MSEKLSYKKGDWIEFSHRTRDGWMTGHVEEVENMEGFAHPFYKVSCYLGHRAVGKGVVSERNYLIRPSAKRFTFDNLLLAFADEA